MSKILFGIDGGGTNSRLAVSDENLKIIERKSGDATNYLKIGIEQAVRNVVELVRSISGDYSGEKKFLVLGTAGAGRTSDVEVLESELKNSLTDFETIKVISDAEITLRGSFENEDGAILIAGTGSILFYKKGNRIERVGGCGRILGDEGSGYTIGRKALNYLSKVFDGREEESNFALHLMNKYNIHSQSDLIDKVYKKNFDIAKTAEDVIMSAEKDGAAASEILQSEAEELVEHVRAIINRENLSELKIVFSGGLLEKENPYKAAVQNRINKLNQPVKILAPKNEPVIGALLYAKDLLNQEEN